MLKALKQILEIQELDMQMIQLVRKRKERQNELDNLNAVKSDLKRQADTKKLEIEETKRVIRVVESEVADTAAKMKKLEGQQGSIKKVEEFNALSHEMSQVDRERIAKEQRASELYDKLAAEEDLLKNLDQTLETTIESSRAVEGEILASIHEINAEGRIIKSRRDKLVDGADQEVFRIYERLLRNKKDRVVVPIENRCCSGCHIMLTAQDENLVRKGERLVFCEHCSRIHYWQESEVLEGTAVATKQRRRTTVTKV